MNPSLLEELGLTVRDGGGGLEAELELTHVPLTNPLTRQPLGKIVFTVMGDRLLVLEPPELVGIPPLSLARVERAQDLEQVIAASFNENIFHLQRRSAELQALGLSPKVEPQTLQLSSDLSVGSFQCVIATDKRGNFRVAHATRGGQELDVSSTHAFELSEFRELGALTGYLQALFAEPHEAPQTAERLVTFGEVIDRFGREALLPPRSALEILLELSVDDAHYRFAAARIAGRSFRGLLAGAAGKVWAERFELDEFPGVKALVAQLLKVPTERVKVLTTVQER